MESRQLLEEREARLKLYFRLLAGLGTSCPANQVAREAILALVHGEIGEIRTYAEKHLRTLATEDEREAFRYAVSIALPYYTHLARLYGSTTRRRRPAMTRRAAAVS